MLLRVGCSSGCRNPRSLLLWLRSVCCPGVLSTVYSLLALPGPATYLPLLVQGPHAGWPHVLPGRALSLLDSSLSPFINRSTHFPDDLNDLSHEYGVVWEPPPHDT